MDFKEMVYWNLNSYGSAVRIRRKYIKGLLISLGVLIPVIVPVPLVLFLSRLIKKDIIWRF